MATQQPDETLLHDPLADLEKSLIAEYLRNLGYDPEKVHELPEETAKRLMTEASVYASSKLTEIESRARFVHDVHGAAPPL